MKREPRFFKFLRKTNTYLCVRGLTGLPTGSCLYGQNESFVLNSFHFGQQLVDILHEQILSLKLITKRPQATPNFSLPSKPSCPPLHSCFSNGLLRHSLVIRSFWQWRHFPGAKFDLRGPKNNGCNALYSLKLTYSDKVSHKLSCKEEKKFRFIYTLTFSLYCIVIRFPARADYLSEVRKIENFTSYLRFSLTLNVQQK